MKRIAALLLGGLLFEVFVVPLVALSFPLAVLIKLPAPIYILGQSSKSNLLPKDYVLVLGDSYAEGQGDWAFKAAKQAGNPPFQATHVLHERTGRDVITFGRGGADSISSLALIPARRFASLRRFGLGEPRDILAYFYEGNDLEGNIDQLERRLGEDRSAWNDVSNDEIDQVISKRVQVGRKRGILNTLLSTYILINLVSQSTSLSVSSDGTQEDLRRVDSLDSAAAGPGPTIESGGNSFRFTRKSQGPALELNEQETAIGLRVFDRSLRSLQMRYPDAAITVVYIPSPLACYALEDEPIAAKSYLGRTLQHTPASVLERSAYLRRAVGELSERLGLGFIDTTSALRAAGNQALIHGPSDGRHLNEAGYRALGTLIGESL